MPLRRSDLSIAPRCPVIPLLRRSDLSARGARDGRRVAGYSYGVTVLPLPACYRQDTPTECVQFHLLPPCVVFSEFSHSLGSRWIVQVQPTNAGGDRFFEIPPTV